MEYRTSDSSSNPYLAFSAMLMAGLDGIKRKLDPADYGLNQGSTAHKLPNSLDAALNCLEGDYEYLLEGNVFTEDVIQAYIAMKRGEFQVISEHIHPIELQYYFGV
ncbi:hypothetical protein ACFFSY_30055 [Paenibacillus aurantiacus]|uniref:glutamine synthetase n=1 Tax=Paenibacillus aurantiacus TaxID=1936118 RepID=A0ABV5KYA0_9BACL